MFPLIHKFEVLDPNILSDQCVVKFSIECKTEIETYPNSNSNMENDTKKLPYTYKWHNEKKMDYIYSFNCEDVINTFETISGWIDQTQNSDLLDSY